MTVIADRRQSAPAVPRRAAGQGAVVLLRRHPGRRCRRASTPSSTQHAPRRDARARADAARAHRGARTASRPKTSSRRRAPPGCCRATAASPTRDEVPAGSRLVAGRWWTPDYQGPPLVSFEKQHRRRARPQDRRPGHRQRARPQHHRDASPICARSIGRASASISCMVFSPGTFRGAPHTHIATLTYPGGGTSRGGSRAAQSRGGRLPDDHHRARAGGARCHRPYRDQPGARDPRRERAHADRGGAGARRRARGRTPASRLRRRHPQDRSARRGCGCSSAYALEYLAARRRHRAVRRGGGLGGRRLDHHQGHEPVVRLAAGPAAGGGRRRRSPQRCCLGWSAPSPRSARSRHPCSATCNLGDAVRTCAQATTRRASPTTCRRR